VVKVKVYVTVRNDWDVGWWSHPRWWGLEASGVLGWIAKSIGTVVVRWRWTRYAFAAWRVA
jgi:hypothetical protein